MDLTQLSIPELEQLISDARAEIRAQRADTAQNAIHSTLDSLEDDINRATAQDPHSIRSKRTAIEVNGKLARLAKDGHFTDPAVKERVSDLLERMLTDILGLSPEKASDMARNDLAGNG